MTRRLFLAGIAVTWLLLLAFATSAYSETVVPSQPLAFMTLADLHFDPFIACQRKRPCPVVEHLRAAPASQWAHILATEDFSETRYQQNTNYWLLTSALQAAGEAATTQRVAFVLILGDLLGHDYRRLFRYYTKDKSLAAYQDFVRKTFIFLTSQFKQAFPHTNVFYAVGNNDSFYRDYINYPHDVFFTQAAYLFAPLILDSQLRAQFQQAFSQNGYYSLTLPQADHLRLIVLNSNFFSYRQKNPAVAQVANQQLAWLQQTLQSARAHHEHVILAMHIPPSIDFYAASHLPIFTLRYLWKREYLDRFQAELREFSPEMAGILVGHLHFDWVQFLPYLPHKIALSGTPAVSPVFGNNPGFKIYTYSLSAHVVDDFLTYYYPLNADDLWQLPQINDDIRQPLCRSCVMIDQLQQLQPNETLYDFYRLLSLQDQASPQLKKHWQSYYWCSIWDQGVDGLKKCFNPLQ